MYFSVFLVKKWSKYQAKVNKNGLLRPEKVKIGFL